MAPTIPIVRQDMAKQIEDEPLPWYLVNAVINPGTGEVLQYNDLIHSKDDKTRSICKNCMSKEFRQLVDGFLGKVYKGTKTIRFISCDKIPV